MNHDWMNLNPGYLDDLYECKRCGVGRAHDETGKFYYFGQDEGLLFLALVPSNYVEPPCVERE